MELETESLYVVGIRKETTLAIRVYRKPTHTADSNQEGQALCNEISGLRRDLRLNG
jgi:hypothetical protein